MKTDQERALLGLTYLGQAGFWVKNGSTQFLIDPYLSNYVVDGGIGAAELFSREFPAPFSVEEFKEVEVVFVTHDHGDHCDPDTLLPLLRLNPRLTIVCSQPAADHLMGLGVSLSNIVVPEIGYEAAVCGLDYYAVPAAHYEFEQNVKTGAYSYLGFVIKVGETWLYHSGDTILYDGMVDQVLKFADKIDIACLPVNGRDGWRERMGMTGNLDGAEALELTLRLKADVLIPIHNDLFAVNHVNMAILADLLDRRAPRQRVHWLQPGETFYY
jgi:L-ascorbate metabolism protein UlaG (beta-lactamase superfamily)